MDAADADVDGFTYASLLYPEKQIRLLSFDHARKESSSPSLSANAAMNQDGIQPTNHEEYDRPMKHDMDHSWCDNEVVCKLSTWDLANSPKFTAISYTWGNPGQLRTITVDGKTLTVRENCSYALSQVRLHWPNNYIWIDSVCIDQLNNLEKGLQVAIMAEIFSKAAQVCACVGKHTNESLSLAGFLAQYAEFRLQKPRIEKDAVVESLGQEDAEIAVQQMREYADVDYLLWIWSHGRLWARQLGQALDYFCNRPYWTRLWILQELRAAGAKGFHILCGPHKMDRRGVCRLLWAAGTIRPTGIGDHKNTYTARQRHEISETALRVWKILHSGDPFSADSGDLLQDFECSDPRDRVFGTLSLLDWAVGGPAIVPDYRISEIDLAWDLLQRLRNAELRDVEIITIHALRIESGPAFQTWIDTKRSSQSENMKMASPGQLWVDYGTHSPASVFLNAAGELCSSFVGPDLLLSEDSVQDGNAGKVPTIWNELSMGRDISILVDAVLRPGDILFQTRFLGLALRPRELNEVDFEIVGRLRPGGIGREGGNNRYHVDNCQCFGQELWYRSVKLQFAASHLDAMDIVVSGYAHEHEGHIPYIPALGATVRDVSTVEIDGEEVHRPLITHLLTCPYMPMDERKPRAKN